MTEWFSHKTLEIGKTIKYKGKAYCPDCCRYETKTILTGLLFGIKPITKELKITPEEVPIGEFNGNTYCLNCGHILGLGIKVKKKRGKK